MSRYWPIAVLLAACASTPARKESPMPAHSSHRCRIDSFEVPAEAYPEFEATMNRNLGFIKKQPGFIEHNVFRKVSGPTAFNVVTTASWEDQAAIDRAGEHLRAYYQTIGFDLPTFTARLGIKASVGVYEPVD